MYYNINFNIYLEFFPLSPRERGEGGEASYYTVITSFSLSDMTLSALPLKE